MLDDFERTIDYAETNGETGLLGGVKAVQAKLSDTLAKGRRGRDQTPPARHSTPLSARPWRTVDDPSVPDETVARGLPDPDTKWVPR